MKVLLLDIETSPAGGWFWGLWDQNISIGQVHTQPRMICFAAKFVGQKSVKFYSEYHDGRLEMLEAIRDLLEEADIVVGWNSKSFDVKWINSELMVEAIPPPPEPKQVDLMTEVKRNARFLSNKLDYVSGRLLDEHKVKHQGFDLWLGCMAGDEKSWSTMRRYNKKDVTLLEPIWNELLPWLRLPVSPALVDNPEGVSEGHCPNCGSQDAESRGYSYTRVSSYRRYRCRSCGKWFPGTNRVGSVRV